MDLSQEALVAALKHKMQSRDDVPSQDTLGSVSPVSLPLAASSPVGEEFLASGSAISAGSSTSFVQGNQTSHSQTQHITMNGGSLFFNSVAPNTMPSSSLVPYSPLIIPPLSTPEHPLPSVPNSPKLVSVVGRSSTHPCPTPTPGRPAQTRTQTLLPPGATRSPSPFTGQDAPTTSSPTQAHPDLPDIPEAVPRKRAYRPHKKRKPCRYFLSPEGCRNG